MTSQQARRGKLSPAKIITIDAAYHNEYSIYCPAVDWVPEPNPQQEPNPHSEAFPFPCNPMGFDA